MHGGQYFSHESWRQQRHTMHNDVPLHKVALSCDILLGCFALHCMLLLLQSIALLITLFHCTAAHGVHCCSALLCANLFLNAHNAIRCSILFQISLHNINRILQLCTALLHAISLEFMLTGQCRNVRTHVQMNTHTHTYIYTYTHLYMYIYKQETHVYVYICIYICIYIYMYIYV